MKVSYIVIPGLLAAAIIAAFVIGRNSGIKYAIARMKPQTKIEYKDSIIYREKPVPVEHTVYKDRRVEVPVYIQTRDTVIREIHLPREERIYRDTAYMAVVSGVDPSLDYLEIYRKDMEVTTTVERVVRQKPRWSLGVQVGYGAYLAEQPDFAPYIGVGISYNILSFGQRSHR